jgi:hypothetical protein
MISFQQNGTVARVWSKNPLLVAARAHESLPLPVEVVHRRVPAIRRRVRKRSVAEIHAVSTITRECGRQEGRIHVAECNAVGRAEAAVDGHAHDGGACSAHVKRKADDVAHRPFAAKTSPRWGLRATSSTERRPQPTRTRHRQRLRHWDTCAVRTPASKSRTARPEKLDDLQLKVKAAPAQPDVSNKRVEALQLQLEGAMAAAVNTSVFPVLKDLASK